jgi:adenosylmethionine-8-amino-7-oxononanoate aminotransferase
VLYWMPPYCVGEEELSRLAEVTTSAVEEATR